MRIAVVGSREYGCMEAVEQFVWECERTTVIVSGGATGVNRAAVRHARLLSMPYEEYMPDWNRHGKRSGALRNMEIVNKSDEIVAFWDERSRGTKIAMDMARAAGKPLRVFGRNGLPLPGWN
jgi:hypothetical protein